MKGDLFGPAPGASDEAAAVDAPLAERMRPRSLDEVVGQDRVLGSGSLLRRLIEEGRPPSMLLWGPPGT
ncbi:MAG: recombination factor protein RarA, partial [Planctomycetota bacterium]